jgi:hypothetical protein
MTENAEHRLAGRRATNRAGVIIAEGREMTCLFRDVSENGARVRVVGAAKIPDEFRLVAPMEKLNACCVVVWRRGSEVGVRFGTDD